MSDNDSSSSNDSGFSMLVFVLVMLYVTLFFGCLALIVQCYCAKRRNSRNSRSSGANEEVTGGEVFVVDLTDGRRIELMAHVLLVNAAAPAAGTPAAECPICMERRALACVDPCDHQFCAPCMLMLVNQGKPCPLCRGPIIDIRALHAPSSASLA